MAFCVYCGTQLGNGNRFCANCGKPVPSAAPAVPPVQPAAPAYPVYPPEHAAPAAPVEDDFFAVFADARQPDPEAAASVPVYAPAPAPIVSAPSFRQEPDSFPKSFDFSQDPVTQDPSSFDPNKMPEDYAVYAAPVFRPEEARREPVFSQDISSFPPLRDTPREPKAPTYAMKNAARQTPAPRVQAPPQPRGALRIIASVLICILLLTAMVPFFTLLTVQNTLHKDTLITLFHRIDLEDIPLDQLDIHADGSLADLICEEVNDAISDTVRSENWAQFTPATLHKFLRETTFPAFIAEHTEGLLRAFLMGEDSYSISSDEVEDLLLDNLDFITGDLDLLLDEDQIHIAARQFVTAGGLDDIELPSVDAGMQDALLIARMAISIRALVPVIIVLVVLIGLLFLTNLKQPLYALRDVGIVCVVGTVLPLLTILGARGFVERAAGTNAAMYLGGLVISCVLERGLLPYIVTFGTGVVILIVHGILRGTQKKRATR